MSDARDYQLPIPLIDRDVGHPEQMVNELDEKTLQALFQSMKDVLTKAIESRAGPEDSPPSSFLIPRRDRGAEYSRCRGAVRILKISGLSAYAALTAGFKLSRVRQR
jgi:hypothetical protein